MKHTVIASLYGSQTLTVECEDVGDGYKVTTDKQTDLALGSNAVLVSADPQLEEKLSHHERKLVVAAAYRRVASELYKIADRMLNGERVPEQTLLAAGQPILKA